MRVSRVLIAGVLLLVSCGGRDLSAANLSSEEVLTRASQEARNLRSAAYELSGSFIMDSRSGSASGDVQMEGVLADAGKQVQFTADYALRLVDTSGTQTAVDGTLEVVVAGENDVYINMRTLEITPESLMTAEAIRGFLSRWWHLPPGTEVAGSADMTPDPALLRAQSEVVSVTKDLGPVLLNGSPAYHYAVAVDPAKLTAYAAAVAAEKGMEFTPEQAAQQFAGLSATGELWIDAVMFQMKKAQWRLDDMPVDAVPGARVSANFTVEMHSYNSAPDVSPPSGALEFDPALILQGAVPALQSVPGGEEYPLPFIMNEDL